MKSTEWMSDAVCATHPYGPDFWFPTVNGKAADRQARQAAQICASCPVQQECREYRAQFGYQFGVWGGRKAPAQYVPATVLPAEHGTEARYKQHLREGSDPCVRCRDAANLVRQLRKERRQRSA